MVGGVNAASAERCTPDKHLFFFILLFFTYIEHRISFRWAQFYISALKMPRYCLTAAILVIGYFRRFLCHRNCAQNHTYMI